MLTFSQFLTESHGDLEVAKTIIKTLHTAGYQAYLAGGCVRDKILGYKPKDYDVATDARPEEVLKIFPKAGKVGAHFGVVIEQGIEIATFRSEGAYSDSRRPDVVRFEKSPREDAARRDFTVNAMFMDPFTGHILDFFGGQEDIKHKILRAVGNPYERFGEDHLRMLRAMRFAAKLGFTIDPATLDAMKGLAPHIKTVAIERSTQEIMGALAFPGGPAKSLTTMHQTGMLSHLLPEVDSLPSRAFQLTVSILNYVHYEKAYFALAAMLSQLDLSTVKRILKRLKVSNEDSEYVLAVLSLQLRITATNPHHTSMDVLKKLMREKEFSDAIKLYGYRVQVHDPHVRSESFYFLNTTRSNMKHEDLHPPKFVNGDDLIALGLKPGKQFKDILAAVENGQLNGTIHNREQAIQMIRGTIR